MWTNGMLRVASAPAMSVGSSVDDENIGELGELHIRRRMTAAKDRSRNGRRRLEDIMKETRELGETSTMSKAGNQWLGAGKPSKGLTIESQPRFVGMQANELSKWMNAESISRYKEEQNAAVPTLRQVLKVDDGVSMKQMTKSQLAALPYDPTDLRRAPRRDPEALPRHATTYRPVMKS